MSEDLWQALDTVLTLKRTRQATVARLNALWRKRFPEARGFDLTEENVQLSRQSFTAGELQRFNPGHDRAEPQQMNGPVVVFEQAGERYMFDGTNRLNVWLRSGDQARHEAIIVKRKEVDA
jgi:hypothetical protein